jgi:uncharacterized protein
MIYEATSFECSRIAQDLQIRKVQVESVVQLFNEGNSVPFIARYRKERTGGLDEDVVRNIQTRLNFVKQLNERKQTMLKSIESHGKLTEELRREIQNAPTVRRLEDLYMPFKPRKKSLAHAARDKGLEPLAFAIWYSDPAVGNLDEMAASLVNPEKQLNTADEVKLGVQHLLAEMIHETAEVRAQVRRVLWKAGAVTSTRNEKAHEGQGNEFKPYFQFKEPAQDIRPHRILALNRGEKEGVLKVKLECPADAVKETALAALAEHLLRDAGKPAPAPSQPAQPVKPPQPEPPAPTPGEPPAPATPPEPAPTPGEPPAPATPPEPAPAAPPPDLPPAEPRPEMPPVAPPETPPLFVPSAPTQAPTELPTPAPMEIPPAGAPPSSQPPHASPLVESLSTEPKPALTGEPLAEGVEFRSPHAAFLKVCLDDALNRLLVPNLEREIRSELTDEAELHAVKVLAHNVRSLLMQPPLTGRRVLAIDPGFRTGCKLAALDETGNLLGHTVLFPHGGGPGGGRRKEKKPKDQPAPAPAPTAAASEAAPATTPPTESPAPAAEATAPTPAPSMETPVPSPELADTTTPTPEIAPVAAQETPPTETPAAAPEAATPEPPPVDKRAEAKTKLVEFIQQHNLNLIALGNGAACRETEEVIAEVIASSLPELTYAIVSEAGASAYSASPVAKEEFPTLDAAVRCAISIGRRLQDPLSELVKIDVQSLGAGLYPHDMGRKELKDALEGVVESCVNAVGVDVNAASAPMLRHVSGLNQLAAREIVEFRKNRGPFTAREQLSDVTGMGPNKYLQSAGFLKVSGAVNPLDRTWIHPESYPLVERIFVELGSVPSSLDDPATHTELRDKLNAVNLEELAKKLEISAQALDDLFMALARPGRDPRQDMPPPIFKKGVLKLEELQPGQELKGTVLNVVDFGAFVDVGLKDSGLVHISQMANKYIKSPYDVVSVNDIVKVWVLKIDKDTNHVSLTMIQPGVERKPPERPPLPRREEGESHDRRGPPRGRGPGGPPREGQREGPRPPRGRSGPPRHGGPPREQQREVAPPPPPPPPRKPRREAPKPKLTQAAMEGKAPLRTLGELAAFFAAKEKKDEPPAPPPVVEEKKEPAPEAPPPESAPPEAKPPESAEIPPAS